MKVCDLNYDQGTIFVRAGKGDKDRYLCCDDETFKLIRQWCEEQFADFQRKLLGMLDGSFTVTEIMEKLQKEEVQCTMSEVLHELGIYRDKLLIEDKAYDLSSDEEESNCNPRYERSRRWFAAKNAHGKAYSRSVEEVLGKCHITLFGLGGLGSLLFTQLALMGIGRITVADYDQVEPSNLNRQVLFCETDLKRKKTEVARERSKLINGALEYDFIDTKIASPGDLAEIMKGADLALLAADTPRKEIFGWMNEASHSADVPVLYTTGVLHVSMGIGPLVIPGKTACYLCSMPEGADLRDPLVEFINSRHCHGIILPTLSICAGIMVYELVKHLTGCDVCSLYDRRLHVDLRTYGTHFQQIIRRENCSYCGTIRKNALTPDDYPHRMPPDRNL